MIDQNNLSIEPVYLYFLYIFYMFLILASLASLHTHVSMLWTSISKVIILSSEYFTLNSDCIMYSGSNAFPTRSSSLVVHQYCISMCSHPFVLLARDAHNHGDYQCHQPCSSLPRDTFGFPLQQQGRRLASFSFLQH